MSNTQTPVIESTQDTGSQWGKLVLAGVIVCVAIGLGVARFKSPAQARASDVWYYDLNSGKLFSHLESVPPIAAPSGPIDGDLAGVLAMVYSCGSCDDESKRFVAWMVKSKPGLAEELEKQYIPAKAVSGVGARLTFLISERPDAWLVRFSHSNDWLENDSAEARKMQARAANQCGAGAAAKPCPGPGVP